jgi:Uma2 family endonuclease
MSPGNEYRGTATTTRATYADLKAVPDNLIAEILLGELVTHPRPRFRHGGIAAALVYELVGPFQKGIGGPGGWLFAVEPELHLGGNVAVPDVAAWRLERATFDFDDVGITVTPDWACEILSPSTERYDRGAKRQIYAEAGLPYLWLIDPRIENLEAFELVGGKWQVVGMAVQLDGDVVARPFSEPLFKLASLWPMPPKKPIQQV